MKSVWNGSITFGLVNIPVKLYSAVESKSFSFRMLDSKTHSPIKYKRISEKTGQEVQWKEIVKGIEIKKGKYFVPTKEQLDAIKPEKSQSIDIVEFVDQDQIDPIFFSSHYFIGPSKEKEKTYFLFKEVLQQTARTALGRFVMRDKEYTCSIKSYKGGLLLTTLNYAYEIRDIKDVDNIAEAPKLQKPELELAKELINKLYKEDFDIAKFKDNFAQEMVKLLKKAAKGEVIEIKHVKEKEKKEENLIEALKASLD
jgi:DNA end-binding protein Ku